MKRKPATKFAAVRVSVRPAIHKELAGYQVKWFDPVRQKDRGIFVLHRNQALVIKQRIKSDRMPTVPSAMWAVKL